MVTADPVVIERMENVTEGRHSAEYVSLRDYFDQRLSEQQRALDIATAALDKRLDGMNEFRQTLNDQSKQFMSRTEQFMSRTEYEGKHEALASRLVALERANERTSGAVSAMRFLVVLIGAPGIAALLWVLAAAFSGKLP